MNPRIFKKRCKLAVQLLRSHDGRPWQYDIGEDVYLHDPTEGWHPGRRIALKGTPVIGRMSGGEEPEWDEYCPLWEWAEVYYWTYVVPDSFRGDIEELPRVTLQQKRDRLKYSAIAPGWRWRGGKAVKIRTACNKDSND